MNSNQPLNNTPNYCLTFQAQPTQFKKLTREAQEYISPRITHSTFQQNSQTWPSYQQALGSPIYSRARAYRFQFSFPPAPPLSRLLPASGSRAMHQLSGPRRVITGPRNFIYLRDALQAQSPAGAANYSRPQGGSGKRASSTRSHISKISGRS